MAITINGINKCKCGSGHLSFVAPRDMSLVLDTDKSPSGRILCVACGNRSEVSYQFDERECGVGCVVNHDLILPNAVKNWNELNIGE